MKKITAFLSTLVILGGTASIAATDLSKLAVAAKFSPNPPRQGSQTIVVSVKDGMGKPVKGAIVKIASNMPTMSMGGPAVAAKENSDGTYSAKINVNFATKWAFDVSATAGKRKGAAHLTADVK